jgi:hypothetical protein
VLQAVVSGNSCARLISCPAEQGFERLSVGWLVLCRYQTMRAMRQARAVQRQTDQTLSMDDFGPGGYSSSLTDDDDSAAEYRLDVQVMWALWGPHDICWLASTVMMANIVVALPVFMMCWLSALVALLLTLTLLLAVFLMGGHVTDPQEIRRQSIQQQGSPGRQRQRGRRQGWSGRGRRFQPGGVDAQGDGQADAPPGPGHTPATGWSRCCCCCCCCRVIAF